MQCRPGGLVVLRRRVVRGALGLLLLLHGSIGLYRGQRHGMLRAVSLESGWLALEAAGPAWSSPEAFAIALSSFAWKSSGGTQVTAELS